MQTHRRNTFTTIRTEGAILPVDLLQRISENDPSLQGLRPTNYHLLPNEKLNEAINRSWNRLIGAWESFQNAQEKVGEGSPGTTVTRERWLLPLFQELGYGRLQTRTAFTINGKSYPISHSWGQAPIHLLGFNIALDKRTPGVAGAAKTSPHSMLQEFLNRSDEHLWAFLSNGLQLRILRDNVSLTRQAYVEFDLQSMMDGEVYADFVLLWLLCNQSRVEGEKPEGFWLEEWSHKAQEQGTRALDQLRAGVEEAITALGSGFLSAAANQVLRTNLRQGTLSTQDYYRQLLRLVYRLIFLFVAEDRDLLFPPASNPAARQRYRDYYSTQRLRRLAERSRGLRHVDLYYTLRLVMGKLSSVTGCPELALPALGGFLFSSEATPDLDNAELPNQQLLDALRALAFTVDNRTLRPVDYKNLGPEELGSVYESLLELHPEMNIEAGTFALTTASGHERKTTGSYYTPSSLIQVLLDSALDPVVEDRLEIVRRMGNGEWGMVNGQWELVNWKWKDEGGKAYANSILPRFRDLAKRHGFGGGSLRIDKELSTSGAVRDDLADEASGGFDPRQHRRGLGADRDERVSTFPEHRSGQPTGTGDSYTAESAGGIMPDRSDQRSVGDDHDPGQADSISKAQSGEEGELANGSGRMAKDPLALHHSPFATSHSPFATSHSPFATSHSPFATIPLAIRHQLLAESALLSLTVCDPACGSGHFLIAAAHRLARHLAGIRTGDDEPSPEATRAALRDVISHCLYGVDLNPMAVELCKVSLWMEALEPGKPLSFLDAHIKCGNSLVGVGPGLGIEEIPDKAFQPAFGDDKATATALRRRNKREREGQLGFRWDVSFIRDQEDIREWLVHQAKLLEAMPENDARQVQEKAIAYANYLKSFNYTQNRLEYDLWTAAFFWPIPKDDAESMLAPTQQELISLREEKQINTELGKQVVEISMSKRFFHWGFEFPHVFDRKYSGFDSVIGNHPWERTSFEEKEFFATKHKEITFARTTAIRKKMIDNLLTEDPKLHKEYKSAKHLSESENIFMKFSNQYKYSATGRINTYALFTEQTTNIISSRGRVGIIVQTGIATDVPMEKFWRYLMEGHRLVSIIDFENKQPIFQDVHREQKFCLLSLTGFQRELESKVKFGFWLTDTSQLSDTNLVFNVSLKELLVINPLTNQPPVCRRKSDFRLISKIYKNNKIMTSCSESTEFHAKAWVGLISASYSKYYKTEDDLAGSIDIEIGAKLLDNQQYLPLLEGKLIHQFDYKYATYEGVALNEVKKGNPILIDELKKNIERPKPRYWIEKSVLDDFYESKCVIEDWVIGIRDVTNVNNERTAIACLLPKVGLLQPLNGVTVNGSQNALFVLGVINSFVLDYVAKQKIPGRHLNVTIFSQLPYPANRIVALERLIKAIVFELSYISIDLKEFAKQVGFSGIPYSWDFDRRFFLRCELDAAFFHLYGIKREEVEFILAIFDLVRKKDFKKYGEYMTMNLILHYYDTMAKAQESGFDYESLNKPLPSI